MPASRRYWGEIKMKRLITACLLLMLLSAVACGDDDDNDDNDASPTDDDATDDDVTDDDAADDDDDDDTSPGDDDDTSPTDDDADDVSPGDYWEPSTVVPIGEYAPLRDYEVIRSIIHLHSVYSHDACDNMPFINGHPNWQCYDQLRAAFCSTNQQVIMMTDHDDSFAYHDYPDVLLYQPDEGDELIYRGQEPIANLITCEDGNEVLLMAGSENDIMPIAMERMPAGTGDERAAFLSRTDAEAVQIMQDDLDAIVFVNHDELWEIEDLLALPIDGIELYNIHANIDPGGIVAPSLVELIFDILAYLFPLSEAGHSDLIMLAFMTENDIDLSHWNDLLLDRPTVGILATDAHRNALPFPLPDGDRADSYRRLMRWFANYLLLEDREVDTIKEAIARGRLYGAFQVFGEPVGFDFHAETGKAVYEMGDTAALSESPEMVVVKPTFWNMNPALPAPEMTMQILRADAAGAVVVAEAVDQDLAYTVTEAGAYWAQVRVIPYHLAPWLGDDAEDWIHDYPLIYANPIYVE